MEKFQHTMSIIFVYSNAFPLTNKMFFQLIFVKRAEAYYLQNIYFISR
jgi:hypothetical protein